MIYNHKPKMILFDVGGTLFDDGKCDAVAGFSELLNYADNPDITDGNTLAKLWDEYLNMVHGSKSESGLPLEIPLSAIIKYACMHTGVKFSIPLSHQEEIFDRYNSSRKVIDGVAELLEELKNLGIRTAVISNNAMSGEALALSIKQWIPSADFEFCLTSADLLLCKPCKSIFTAAISYAGLFPSDCWYCGDGKNPDIMGALNSGMLPVLYDSHAQNPFEICADEEKRQYITIKHWNELKRHLLNM